MVSDCAGEKAMSRALQLGWPRLCCSCSCSDARSSRDWSASTLDPQRRACRQYVWACFLVAVWGGVGVRGGRRTGWAGAEVGPGIGRDGCEGTSMI